MRVLAVGNMYPPHHLGGYELVWQSSNAALRAAGHQVEVLTTNFRRPGTAEADEPGVHRELRWWWRDYDFPRLSPRGRLALERHNRAAFEGRIGAWRPNVVAWWPMGGMSLSLLAQAGEAGLPSAAFVHDDWLLYGPRVDQWTRMFARSRRLGRWAERRWGIPTRVATKAVDRWLFVSDWVRQRALGAGWELRATGLAPSGIDPAFLGPAPAREWGWRMLYVGRVERAKGADVAVEALAALPAQATLTLVGDADPDHARVLRERAARLGVEARVDLRPAVPRTELLAVYDTHDAVLFPALWDEPWGLVPLEAMARGRPVVATGSGGSAEYLRDGENCLLVPRGDAPALTAAVRRLAEEPALRERLRAGGRPTAARHTEDRFNAAVVEALERVGGA